MVGYALPASAALAQTEPLHINSPTLYGARPGVPFLYHIPVAGDPPLTYVVEGLPPGLSVDAETGIISGKTIAIGSFATRIIVHQGATVAQKPLRIVIGEEIGLTPAMGWNSWNCWAGSVDAAKVLKAAQAMVRSGLSKHGWTYINIDDTWQGSRDPVSHALQANEKFPDIAGLCNEIHRLGLKTGIYSTPWITSYAGYVGGSSDSPAGAWTAEYKNTKIGRQFGRVSFAQEDARQWAQWGFDYLKYDWRPNDVPHVQEMARALRQSGRDIIFSLSNAAPIELANQWKKFANSWRTTGDIRDLWTESATEQNFYGISEIGFSQDPWASYSTPGHFNDPDMLVVGDVGWNAVLHPTRLTQDEQFNHFSLWCLLSAPLLLGCDLDHLDAFTLSLLTNDEVIALDQDALGIPATRVATSGAIDVYKKPLDDQTIALGFFNRGDSAAQINFGKFSRIGLNGSYHIRDLWKHTDLPDIADARTTVLPIIIPAHGVVLYKLSSAK